MKQLVLSLLLGVFTLSATAQGIVFEENHDLNVALAKAKAENKLVFIDAYAEWCGPCKVMARDIFPKKEVGDFFNAQFVNMKLDMEKQENLYIARKYEVKAYPSYLFLDADGNLVHKGLGSMPADKFIEVAKVAADSENNYLALSRKIRNGDRSITIIKKFLDQNPYDKGNGALVDSYFQTLSENQIFTEENWELFNKYVDDFDSQSFMYFLENRERIAGYIGNSQVNEKIYKTMLNTYMQNPAKEENLKKIDAVLFEKAERTVNISKTYGKFRQNKEDKTAWNDLMQAFTPYLNESNNPAELNNIAWLVYENYKKFNDKNALKNALGWAKKAHVAAPDKDFITDTYAHLLFENGKKKDALKMAELALEMATKTQNTEAIENYKATIAKFKGKK